MAVLVIADHDNVHVRDTTNKTVTAALKLSSDVDVLVAGKGCDAAAAAAAKIAGVRKVLQAESDTLDEGMAEAYQADPSLAARLHVERARVLDGALAQPDAAKAALTRALELDPGIGPVRTACLWHAAGHSDAAWLVELLLQEAVLEGTGPRAAALEVDAAYQTISGSYFEAQTTIAGISASPAAALWVDF